ncbi:ATP-binding protein [Rhizobium sp. BK376]|uniref:ATP-binding protein n=1 Tax=Rhizobium sp. BK376 TaxID=2512149 RepID=UPI001052D4CD|nr:ATP-binding protein [Rhizobium sp. BK376]TCR85296.1 two-component system OmpR family sensor kinase [Rhizobium sp. BK376]
MISLRTATASSLAILFTGIAVVVGATSYLSTMRESGDFLDLQQRQIARYVGDLTFIASGEAALPPHDSEDDYVIEVTYADGRPAKTSDPSVVIPDQPATGFSEFSDRNGQWRVFSLVTPGRTVQVAQQVVVRRELAADAAARAIVPFLVAIPLSWLLVALVAGRIFRSLERLGDEISRKATTDVEPLDLSTMPREVWPFVRSMNELISRLGVALRRQQMFLSDAAHELRTPLSALTLQIGNLSQHRGADLEERLTDLRAGARRVSALTDKLLKISRYEGQNPASTPAWLDLSEVVKDVVSGLLVSAEEKQVDLGFSGLAENARVRVDLDDLQTLCETLVDNAVRYTPNGGAVDVTVTGGPYPLLIVADNGPGVAAEELPRLTERFFRGSSGGEGTGLGLAIVHAICVRQGLSLQLQNRAEGGFLVQVGFPRPKD